MKHDIQIYKISMKLFYVVKIPHPDNYKKYFYGWMKGVVVVVIIEREVFFQGYSKSKICMIFNIGLHSFGTLFN